MNKLILRLYYFFRTYANETLSFFIALAGAWIAYIFYKNPNLQFMSLVVLALTSYVIIIFLKLKSRDFYFIFLDNYTDKKDWVGNGYFDYDQKNKSFLIKDSDAGFIFSKCFDWTDYEISCEFKILNNCLGVILRASDLSNYLMLQINKKANGIRPHFRANGGWLPKEPEEYGLKFENSLEDGHWYKLVVTVNKNIVNIIMSKNDKCIFERQWDVPSTHLSFPVRKKENTEEQIGMLDINKDYSYGTVGFRDGHGEKALVRNLLIKKT